MQRGREPCSVTYTQVSSLRQMAWEDSLRNRKFVLFLLIFKECMLTIEPPNNLF